MRKYTHGLRMLVHLDGLGDFDGSGHVDVRHPERETEWHQLLEVVVLQVAGALNLAVEPSGSPAAILIELVPFGATSAAAALLRPVGSAYGEDKPVIVWDAFVPKGVSLG